MHNIETDEDKYIEEEDNRVDSKAVVFKAKNHTNFINNNFEYYEIDSET